MTIEEILARYRLTGILPPISGGDGTEGPTGVSGPPEPPKPTPDGNPSGPTGTIGFQAITSQDQLDQIIKDRIARAERSVRDTMSSEIEQQVRKKLEEQAEKDRL